MSPYRNETIADWRERVDARNEAILAAPHFVYRAFDSYGHLLYVGCTKDAKKRLATHRRGAPWFRFAETIGIAGPYDGRDAARAIESEAIDTEGPYFNCTSEQTRALLANLNEAKQMLWRRGWFEPQADTDGIDWRTDTEGWDAAFEAVAEGQDAWRRAVERNRATIKAGAFPYMTDADRMARYLAAREDAESARQEMAA